MNCERARVEISSRLDGEAVGVDPGSLDAHVAGCAACRDYLATAEQLHRAVRVRPAETVPDLASAVLAAAPTHGYRAFARFALLTISITIVVLATPLLIFGHDGSAPAHLARHLGAFDVALGVGLFVCAWRPQRARNFLPIAAALAGSMLITAVIDASDGTTPLLGESYHLLEVAGLALVWMLAGFPAPRLDRRSLQFVA